MEGKSPKPASAPTGAVFLSYASQDVTAAQRICEALRTAGIEVWFEQRRPSIPQANAAATVSHSPLETVVSPVLKRIFRPRWSKWKGMISHSPLHRSQHRVRECHIG